MPAASATMSRVLPFLTGCADSAHPVKFCFAASLTLSPPPAAIPSLAFGLSSSSSRRASATASVGVKSLRQVFDFEHLLASRSAFALDAGIVDGLSVNRLAAAARCWARPAAGHLAVTPPA